MLLLLSFVTNKSAPLLPCRVVGAQPWKASLQLACVVNGEALSFLFCKNQRTRGLGGYMEADGMVVS
jgi:hypothetical protein